MFHNVYINMYILFIFLFIPGKLISKSFFWNYFHVLNFDAAYLITFEFSAMRAISNNRYRTIRTISKIKASAYCKSIQQLGSFKIFTLYILWNRPFCICIYLYWSIKRTRLFKSVWIERSSRHSPRQMHEGQKYFKNKAVGIGRLVWQWTLRVGWRCNGKKFAKGE